MTLSLPMCVFKVKGTTWPWQIMKNVLGEVIRYKNGEMHSLKLQICQDGICKALLMVSEEKIDSLGHFSTIGIRDLADKCLINCHGPWISMHSLIRDMGREIIRSESPNNSSEFSRLWCHNDINDVLTGRHKGVKKIEMIVLNSPMENIECKYNTKAFKGMKNLRFLQIDGVHLEGNFKHLPRKALRYLQWNWCPLKYIPSSYFFEKLVRLEMRESSIKEFRAPLKYFRYLECLDLDGSELLTRTPNFSGAQNLRMVSFCGCSNLEKVHSSIGDLRMLVDLNLSYCKRLKKIPKNFWQLRSVEDPSSSVCYSSKIKELLENSEKLTSLRWLRLNGTNIRSLPSNNDLKVIQEFPHNLIHIGLANCKNLEVVSTLPTSLKEINLMGCKNLKMLPELPQNLRYLWANNCVSLEKVNLPKMLKDVDLTGCKKLKEIRGCENTQFLWGIKLRGVPHIKFSEIIEQVLKSSKLDFFISFQCSLPDSETLSRIRCQVNGSSISFRWTLSNFEFVGICIWVVLKLWSRNCSYYCTLEKDGFKLCSGCPDWIELLEDQLLEGENISFLHFIPWHWCKDIKTGEVIKIIPKTEDVEKCMVKKIGVEALYRDRDGFLQFLPLN
ncbi:PREDICTED: protein VARIATION IN COMPOUND TRIGGERED ROOT growth response-like [Ipomoea nil]|uniref:protein VARIATION IN COMPOUND TRIGGERED ROOT growth response-like n=1 Tax=Ipomoea nil TaxID=35883 RepID=UPI000901AA9B|nr:PREDICTED: protein VARIATION IN COMPOUND TRIGGERED ROOT growth response-like [Ipomoea nil]